MNSNNQGAIGAEEESLSIAKVQENIGFLTKKVSKSPVREVVKDEIKISFAIRCLNWVWSAEIHMQEFPNFRCPMTVMRI